MASATPFKKPTLCMSCLTTFTGEVTASLVLRNFLMRSLTRRFHNMESWGVLPPKDSVELLTTPSKAREEQPGSKRDLSKASLLTRTVLEVLREKMH